MKNLKLAFIFLFILGTSVTALSQNEGIESFNNTMAGASKLRGDVYYTFYDQPELRGKFLSVVGNPKVWKKFITMKDGSYIGVFAPGVEWDLYTEDNMVYEPIMIKSTVDYYYDSFIKHIRYDRYEYEVLTQDDGTVQEIYTLFKDGVFYREYMVGWHYNKICSISEYKEQ
jgi:hypothetical protein